MRRMRAMHCATVQKLLNGYYDAELDVGTRTEVERHLAACPLCREALAKVEGVAGLWVTRTLPPVPEGFAERVMRQARRRTKPRSAPSWSDWPFLRWWREQSLAMRAAAVATIMAGFVAGSVLGLSSPPAEAGLRVESSSAAAADLEVLTGAPHGTLEHNYLVLAFPSEISKPSP